MKIRFEDASAADLRQYLKERHNIDRPALSNKKSLLKTLRDIGEDGEEFEIAGSGSPGGKPANGADAHRAPTDEELEREANSFDPEKLVEALMAQGMAEDEAREVAGLTVNAQIQKQIGDGEMPYGPGKEDLYVTVRIRPEKGKFGSEPVPLSVNGNLLYVPRGVDFPIRTPYLECLMHAEQIVYEDVVRLDEYGVPHHRHVPKKTLTHPVELLTPIPYDRAQAEKVAAKAKLQMAAVAA